MLFLVDLKLSLLHEGEHMIIHTCEQLLRKVLEPKGKGQDTVVS